MSSAFAALLIFLVAVSIDSLTAGLTYGTQRVQIKFPAYLILTCVPAVFITTANRIGSSLSLLIPASALPVLSFTLLFILGCSKLSESMIRLLARKHPSLTRNWGCKIKQINIIFTVYLSPEALLLSLALSLDSVLVGMAFNTGPVPAAALFILSAIFNLTLFAAGYGLGHLVSSVLHIDLSWLSGLFLLLLAVNSLL